MSNPTESGDRRLNRTAVYLDPDDSIASIRSKLESAQSGEVTIVARKGVSMLRNPIVPSTSAAMQARQEGRFLL